MDMKTGHVYLIGAGCGRGLITLRGLELIRKADAIVYDDLIDTSLLDKAPADCRILYMGKRSGRKSAGQEEINEKLYELASAGFMVVRLKGGDPFVFGRGGEEYLYLSQRGIPCTPVPGVSSCIAVPEDAGIPVTHRGSAGSFTVITGHSAKGNFQDYRALANTPGTLVFLMGLKNSGEITEQLMKFGKDPDTPAAVISKGFTPQEKRIDGKLSDIAEKAAQAETPAVLVIGKNAAYHFSDGENTSDRRNVSDIRDAADKENTLARDDLSDRKDAVDENENPLSGMTAAILGSPSFTEKVRKKLIRLGCRVETCPILTIRERDISLPDFRSYSHIVFTSSNGVRTFFHMLEEQKRDLRELMHAKFAVIGSATAQTLYSYGIHADLIPADFTSRSLAEELVKEAEDDRMRVLILRALEGSKDLNAILEEHQIAYDDLGIYETVIDERKLPDIKSTPAEEKIPDDRNMSVERELTDSPQFSYVIFGSSASVRAYFKGRDPKEDYGRTRFVCIGEVSARTLRSLTEAPMIMADTYTADGIVSAITRDAEES
jgi:uroporphyrinogen III methyltransferase/synthase